MIGQEAGQIALNAAWLSRRPNWTWNGCKKSANAGKGVLAARGKRVVVFTDSIAPDTASVSVAAPRGHVMAHKTGRIQGGYGP